MKLIGFGVLLLIAYCVKNALSIDSDSDIDEIDLAHYANEVASIAQFKKDELNGQHIPDGSSYAPQLLLAEPHGISRVNLTNSIRWMVERTENTGGLDYHFNRDRLYWSDLSTGRIYTRFLNNRSLQSYQKEIFVERPPGSWRPRALAVDHITDQLYVVDTIGGTVHVFDLNNPNNYVTFPEFLKNPLDIAVDPTQGYMFIADDTRVVRASLDGKSALSIVDQSLHYISTVTLDVNRKRVYWSEYSFRRIKSSFYDGSDKRVVIRSEEGQVYNLLGTSSIALYQSHLYFYDEAWKNIAKINVNGPGGRAIDRTYNVVYQWITVGALRIVHPSLQKSISNPCANEECSIHQMCFIIPKEAKLGFTCADPTGSTSRIQNEENQ